MQKLLVAALFFVAACGSQAPGRTLSYGDNARAAYEAALSDFRDDDCLDAEPEFRRVRRDFPYSRFAALSELRIADCLMKQSKWPEAITAYRQFVRSRPSHQQVSYARFRIAEAHYKQIPTDWLLSPPAYERDQGPTREALRQLKRFILDFPEDDRVRDAHRMVRRCLNQLARHELYVAQFYLDRDHPQAAAERLRTLLTAYEGSGLEPEAMLLLAETYEELRQREEAKRTLRELLERFPRSSHASEAREELDRIDG